MTGIPFAEQFAHYLAPREDAERRAFLSGLIVLDTNVLLDVYRFAPEARSQLLSVIEQLSERIWIPHQVGEEFYRSRIKVMVDLRKSYGDLLRQVKEAEKELIESLQGNLGELANRVLLLEEREELEALLKSALTPMADKISELEEKHRLEGSFAEDPILDRLESLLHGRIGEPFTGDFDERMAEAKRRKEGKIPPGYKDSGKPENWYGDCFVWLQSLEQAKAQSAHTLLIVTEDVKEDWYRREQGHTISAKPELIQEAKEDAGCDLLLMRVSSFLIKAKRYVEADVSERTIREAESLSRRHDVRSRIENLRQKYISARERYGQTTEILHDVNSSIERVEQNMLRADEELSQELGSLTPHDSAETSREHEEFKDTMNRQLTDLLSIRDRVESAHSETIRDLQNTERMLSKFEAEAAAIENSQV